MNVDAVLVPEIDHAIVSPFRWLADVNEAVERAFTEHVPIPPGSEPLSPKTSTAPRVQCDTQTDGADVRGRRDLSAPFLTEEDF